MNPGNIQEQFDDAVQAFWRDSGPVLAGWANGDYEFDRDPEQVLAAYNASFRLVKASGARLLAWSEGRGDKAAAESCRRTIAECVNCYRDLSRRIREVQVGGSERRNSEEAHEGGASANAQEAPGERARNGGSHAHGQWDSRTGDGSGAHYRNNHGRRSANEDEENARRYREQMEQTARQEAERRAREQAEREAREQRRTEEWEEQVRARQQEQQARDDERRRAFEERARWRMRREQHRRQQAVWVRRVYVGLVILFLSLGFGGVISDVIHKPQMQPYLVPQKASNWSTSH